LKTWSKQANSAAVYKKISSYANLKLNKGEGT
jgi:hypothetical protein